LGTAKFSKKGDERDAKNESHVDLVGRSDEQCESSSSRLIRLIRLMSDEQCENLVQSLIF
jgi:hypothetical protein